MKYRICPVCDQKMKSAHYCSNCRAWVKNPWVREVDYYLNERHPSWEKDCSYHSPGGSRGQTVSQGHGTTTGQKKGGAGEPSGTSASQGRGKTAATASYGGTTARQPSGARYASAVQNKAARGKTYTHVAGGSYGAPQIPRASGDPKRWIVVAAVIFISLSILIQVGSVFFKLSGSHSQVPPENDEYDVDMGEYGLEEDDYWYEDMSDEEVRAAGIACNGMNHFVVTGEEMEDAMREVMDAYGYDFTRVERWTDNGRSSDGVCWYESNVQIKIATENQEVTPYILINCDTVTGQLHWLDIDLESREDMILFVKRALQTMEAGQEMDLENRILEQFETDLVPLMEKAEGFDYILGDVEIDGTRYDDIYSISIWPAPWAEDAGGVGDES